jgi:serine/threonine protein kinase
MIDLFMGRSRRETWRIDDEFEGQRRRRYSVGDRIKSGGNAVIHVCYDNASGDEYAVKFQLRLYDRRRERFLQEIKVLKQVNHAHVARHHDDGWLATHNQRGRIPFLVMEKANSDLKTLLEQQPELSYETYIAQFKGLAHGLAALHAGAIHRDIKPENILRFGERWALSDLGLCQVPNSALTRHDEKVGPVIWMSPEAANKACGCADAILTASDVYQLASVFWFVLTGRHPTGVVTRADYRGPEHLFDLFHRCLSHNPRNRPADGRAFALALDAAVLSAGAAPAAPAAPATAAPPAASKTTE